MVDPKLSHTHINKVNNNDKTIRRQLSRSGIFNFNFEYNQRIILLSFSLTLKVIAKTRQFSHNYLVSNLSRERPIIRDLTARLMFHSYTP